LVFLFFFLHSNPKNKIKTPLPDLAFKQLNSAPTSSSSSSSFFFFQKVMQTDLVSKRHAILKLRETHSFLLHTKPTKKKKKKKTQNTKQTNKQTSVSSV
jgi:hypothetical protein